MPSFGSRLMLLAGGWVLCPALLLAQPAAPRLRLVEGTLCHSGGVTSVNYRKGPSQILTAGGDGTVRLWDPGTGRLIRRYEGHGGWICYAAVSSDGSLVAGAGYGNGKANSVHVWDVATGRLRHRLGGHSGGSRTVAFSPDGKHLATGGFDGVIRLWDLTTGQEIRAFEGHSGGVPALAFSTNGRTLVSGGYDGSLRAWDTRGLQPQRLLIEPRARGIYFVALSPDGRLVAVAGDEALIVLVEAETGRTVRTLPATKGIVHSLAFSADGRLLASGGYDNTAHLWEVLSGQLIRSFSGHSEWIWGVAISPDGRTLATASKDTSAVLWSVLPSPLAGNPEELWTQLHSPDSGRAYAALAALAEQPEAAVGLLAHRLHPATAPDLPNLGDVARELARLDDDSFDTREAATARLRRVAWYFYAELKQALATTQSPEVRRRLQPLLESVEQPVITPERLGESRAVQALERMGTSEAHCLLVYLSSGDAMAPLTQEACAALARLEKPPPALPCSGDP